VVAWSRQRGQATVELALLLPLVVIALLAVVQVGLVVRDQLSVVHAAREAVRVASVDPDSAHVRDAVGRVVHGASVEISARGRVGDTIEVTVSRRSLTNLPLVGALFPDPMLHAHAVMRIER
jgi:Flp pilus assembly protein TadG